jgi:hypothetical protein
LVEATNLRMIIMKPALLLNVFVLLCLMGCPNTSDAEPSQQDGGSTDGTSEGHTDGAQNRDAGSSDGTVDGATDGTAVTDAGSSEGATDGTLNPDAGSSDGATDGTLNPDAGSSDGACELAAAVGGCPECADGDVTCSFAGMSVTRMSCGGCQARQALLQALCESGATASAAEIETGMICEDAQPVSEGDGGTAVDDGVSTTINVISCALDPVGEDDIWNPGESAHINCQVRNEGPVDHMMYPQVVIATTTTGITVTASTTTFYGIGYGEDWQESVQASFLVMANAALTTPTTATFTAHVQNMNNEGCGTEYLPCVHNTPFVFEVQVE